jgi:Tfp pilus assembly protein FimV
MSAATEFAPVVYIPPRARRHEPSATVLTLHRPSERSVAAPLRLTRRGVVAVALTVAALAVGLVTTAWLSAPSRLAAPPRPDVVTVQSGDTLWSIATRVAPSRDPRAEVAELQRVNHLDGVELAAGQLLRTH